MNILRIFSTFLLSSSLCVASDTHPPHDWSTGLAGQSMPSTASSSPVLAIPAALSQVLGSLITYVEGLQAKEAQHAAEKKNLWQIIRGTSSKNKKMKHELKELRKVLREQTTKRSRNSSFSSEISIPPPGSNAPRDILTLTAEVEEICAIAQAHGYVVINLDSETPASTTKESTSGDSVEISHSLPKPTSQDLSYLVEGSDLVRALRKLPIEAPYGSHTFDEVSATLDFLETPEGQKFQRIFHIAPLRKFFGDDLAQRLDEDAPQECVYTIDFGSSSIKMKKFGVSLDADGKKILTPMGLDISQSFSMGDALSKDNEIPDDTRSTLLKGAVENIEDGLKSLKYDGESHIYGVATAWARKANTSAPSFLENVAKEIPNLQLSRISQEDEGLVGYYAAYSALARFNTLRSQIPFLCSVLPEKLDSLISWDVGGRSMQLVAKGSAKFGEFWNQGVGISSQNFRDSFSDKIFTMREAFRKKLQEQKEQNPALSKTQELSKAVDFIEQGYREIYKEAYDLALSHFGPESSFKYKEFQDRLIQPLTSRDYESDSVRATGGNLWGIGSAHKAVRDLVNIMVHKIPVPALLDEEYRLRPQYYSYNRRDIDTAIMKFAYASDEFLMKRLALNDLSLAQSQLSNLFMMRACMDVLGLSVVNVMPVTGGAGIVTLYDEKAKKPESTTEATEVAAKV